MWWKRLIKQHDLIKTFHMSVICPVTMFNCWRCSDFFMLVWNLNMFVSVALPWCDVWILQETLTLTHMKRFKQLKDGRSCRCDHVCNSYIYIHLYIHLLTYSRQSGFHSCWLTSSSGRRTFNVFYFLLISLFLNSLPSFVVKSAVKLNYILYYIYCMSFVSIPLPFKVLF